MPKRLIEALRDQAHTIELAVKRLSAAKAQVEEHLAEQLHYLSPIHRMPTEILLLIFLLTVDPHVYPRQSPSLVNDTKLL